MPSDPCDAALSAGKLFCESRVPEQHGNEVRLECSRRGNSITIVGGALLGSPELIGPDWTSMRVAQLRYALVRPVVAVLLRPQRALVALRQHRV